MVLRSRTFALDPDGGHFVEVAEARHGRRRAVAVALHAEACAREQIADQRHHAKKCREGNQPFPVEDLLDGNLIDTVSGFRNGLPHHGRE